MMPRGIGTRRGAFTLIEILVVIAVIALVISLLLPALGKARQAGRATVCLSNQAQIGVAMIMYADYFKGWIPREGTLLFPPEPQRARLPYTIGLRPFLDESVSFDQDPDDQYQHAFYFWDPARLPDNHHVHFIVNAMPFTAPGVVDPRAASDHHWRRGPTLLSRLYRPNTTIYLTDFTQDDSGALYAAMIGEGTSDLAIGQFYDLWNIDQMRPGGPNDLFHADRIAPFRHGLGTNATYLDGHAKFIRGQDLIDINIWDDGDYKRPRDRW
jgi:prepilin-type N-terminal cleavage/methylation domain-containing protein/prepilin-type processing-associated H-X9-DG protein